VIHTERLSKSFGPIRAVDRLDLHVPRGELFCFVGPNGAGKTTTIKMLTGLVRPDEGVIRIAGIDIQSAPVAVKRRIGYIPDMPYLYERLTPVEFLQFMGDLYNVQHHEIARTIKESFDLFGMVSCRNALIADLSHGMRQRLLYVATFMHKPDVMFIDEPLVGLDPYTIRIIKDLLRRKSREGMTIFLTTHILSLAEEIADRIGIISRGRLIALGTMDELIQEAGAESTLESIFLKLTTTDHEKPTADRGV